MAWILIGERGVVGVKEKATKFPAQVLRSVLEQRAKEGAGFCACSWITLPQFPFACLLHGPFLFIKKLYFSTTVRLEWYDFSRSIFYPPKISNTEKGKACL